MAGHWTPGTGHPRVTLTGFTHPEGKVIVTQRPGLIDAGLGRERQNPVLSRECWWAGSIFFSLSEKRGRAELLPGSWAET